MNVGEFLTNGTKRLQQAGIETARLDCLVLLEDTLNKNRTRLLAHPEMKIDDEQLMYLWGAIDRRAKHEPLAYIRGKSEFYGREFIINEHVLEPRPESETMIDLLKAVATGDLAPRPRIADIGTGSGALGITAKLELPDAQVDLIEIDAKAMTVAQKNVNKFSVNVTCTKSDLLTHVTGRYDVVLANLPYVPDDFHINPAALMEPRIAIFGGPDGLDVYRRLFAQFEDSAQQPSFVFTEALPPQHGKLADIARAAGYELSKTEDFIQQFQPVSH
jgi:release factor glutamine methyltransferase